jgi:hypothetical protein
MSDTNTLPPVVYIAGPFRASTPWGVEQNVRRAEMVALLVWEMGGAALCPHTNTRFFDKALPDEIWLNGDLALLAKCDALMLTENWAQSTGARAERAFAEGRGIPVFETLPALLDWVRTR